MIRRSTVFWFSIAALAGYAMYQLKYDVVALEEQLAERNQAILTHQEAIHVLRAEWAYLNEPKRLASLAERHLALVPQSEIPVAAVTELVGHPDLAGLDPVPTAIPTVPTPKPKPKLAMLAKQGTR